MWTLHPLSIIKIFLVNRTVDNGQVLTLFTKYQSLLNLFLLFNIRLIEPGPNRKETEGPGHYTFIENIR